MAGRLLRSLSIDLIYLNSQQIRYGHHLRGKPPTIARSLKQRLEELNRKDPSIAFEVDIGLPSSTTAKKTLMAAWSKEVEAHRSDPNYERKARKGELNIDLDDIEKTWWQTLAPHHIYQIAKHYGIYKDLYGDAYFIPAVKLQIDYDFEDEETLARVYRGNVIKPSEARNTPFVHYEADSNSLWTLLLTTPDGNMQNANNEYCHWFIANIPGNQIDKGEQLIDYMRPIPQHGIGYCRYIFVLYKQEKRMDFSKYKKQQPCLDLTERNWNTLDFYRTYQDDITPAGLAFFQSDWDSSLTDFYHHTLRMKEPIFQYDFPKPYVKPQEWFPLRRAFNLYLDRYRDPKEIQKEFLLKKLKNVHPFKAPDPPLKYPNAYAYPKTMPTWLRTEKTKERLGQGRINNLNDETMTT